MRKLVPLTILALSLLVASVPAEAQSSDEYGWAYLFAGEAALLTIDAAPNAVIFTMHDITIDGDLARDARAAIDSADGVGNGDGTVDDNEVVGIEAILQSMINSVLPNEFDLTMITIDGMKPYAAEDRLVEIMALDVKGAEGSIESGAAIKTDVKVKLLFDSVDHGATSHTIRFENLYGDFSGHDVSDAPPVRVEVSAYKSWTIQKDTIAPAEFQDRLAGDTLVFEKADMAYFDEEGEGLEFTIKGDPADLIKDEKDTPAAPLVVLLGILGMLGVALRRKQ